MKYLCLCYYDAEKFATMTESELVKIGPNCIPHDAALRATGQVIVQGSLPSQWKKITPNQGKPVISDGPTLANDLQAGAFFIVDADNLDDAVSSKHASANFGEHLGFSVEVRTSEMYEATR